MLDSELCEALEWARDNTTFAWPKEADVVTSLIAWHQQGKKYSDKQKQYILGILARNQLGGK